jgi:hypothetical protein
MSTWGIFWVGLFTLNAVLGLAQIWAGVLKHRASGVKKNERA